MRTRLVLMLTLLVLAPLALLSWLGVRVVQAERAERRAERAEVVDRFNTVLAQRLADRDSEIMQLLNERRQELIRANEQLTDTSPNALRAMARELPAVSQVFLLTPQGGLAFPTNAGGVTKQEMAFLQRTSQIWADEALFSGGDDVPLPQNSAPPGQQIEQAFVPNAPMPVSQMQQAGVPQSSASGTSRSGSLSGQDLALPQQFRASEDASEVQQAEPQGARRSQQLRQRDDLRSWRPPMDPGEVQLPQMQQQADVIALPRQQRRRSRSLDGFESGWYSYYHGAGLHLLYWQRRDDGRFFGAEFSRARLLADVVAKLPQTRPDDPPSRGLIRLLDSGSDIYTWGTYKPAVGEQPRVSRMVSDPLSGWRLEYYVPPEPVLEAPGSRLAYPVAVALGAMALVLVGLAVFVYRESSREWRTAQQRVNFVNQVSHELKTPLTNIRLYAELLQNSLDEDDGALEHADVIAQESQRLSRLIANVLSFARKQRGTLKVHRSAQVVDETVRKVLEQFGPRLEAAGIECDFQGAAGEVVAFDSDALEQILGNLIANVEKYAADGKRLEIRTRLEKVQAVVEVRDFGPGVPRRESERIFEPFVRLSDKLSDGVAGTGIGLGISRDLARFHGGDLVLKTCERGALFELRLAIQRPADTN